VQRTLGIDLGSSAVKVVMLDTELGIVGEASQTNAIHGDHPGWAEADPGQWWRNVVECTRRVVAETRTPSAAVMAISVSGMVPAVVLVDEEQRPVRRAILQNDARGSNEVSALTTELADLDLLGLTGSALTQQSVAPTLLWVSQHEPDSWRRTATVMGSYDWLLVRLGATTHVERNWAIESGLFDLEGLAIERVAQAAGFPLSMLPEIRDPGDPVGTLAPEAAAALDVRADIPLVVGGADHVLSAYAAGLRERGETLFKLGGAGDILVVAEGPILDPRLYLDRHPAPGLWLSNGCMATSGTLLRWFQREIGRDATVEELDGEAAASSAGANGLVCLPYLLGEKSPLHDPDLRGAFLGLHLGTTRGDLFRACLESVAFAFRHHLDVYAELGFTPTAVRVTNGGSRSRLWKQIVADVCGVTLQPLSGHPGASLGAAVVAALGVGILDGWSDMGRFVALADPITPAPGLRQEYTETYQVFRQATEVVTAISHNLSRAS
jgi:xylulokinase